MNAWWWLMVWGHSVGLLAGWTALDGDAVGPPLTRSQRSDATAVSVAAFLVCATCIVGRGAA